MSKKKKYPGLEGLGHQKELGHQEEQDNVSNVFEDLELDEEEQLDEPLEKPRFVDPTQYKEDAPLFPGGPLMSELKGWEKMVKNQGPAHNVYITPVTDDFVVIWRTMNRVEYKEIVAIPGTTPLQREEMICEQCVLYPKKYNFETMAKGLGGLPSSLAKQIMEASGFFLQTNYQPLF